jgi:hypothetical protein
VELAAKLAVWILFWLVVFGLFFVLMKNGITYTKRYGITIGFFVLSTLLAILIFGVPNTGRIDPLSLVVPVMVYLLAIVLYDVSRKKLQKPRFLLSQYPTQEFLKMDYRYLFSKTFDLLFQQTMIVIGVFLLRDAGFPTSLIMFWFFALFGLIHIPLIKTAGRLFGIYYLVAALVGAIAFPLLILHVPSGIVYSYSVHLLFYTVSSVMFWKHGKRIARM